MAEETPSADSLVTETTTVVEQAKPFTQPNPDPAHVLDPIKAGQPVSSPHVEHGAKPKRQRAPSKAVRAKKRSAAQIAASVARMAAGRARKAASSSNQAFIDSGRAERAAAVAHEQISFADLPHDAALTLRLADDDTFLDGTIMVGEGEIIPAANGHTYTKDLDIGPDGPLVVVTDVWLVSLSGEAVRCAVGPVSAGGGYHAKIPAGHLKF